MKIAENVFGYRTAIANIAYIAGLGPKKEDWVLIDTGIPYSASFILKNTKQLFNEKKPLAIILTHAHFDHIGALQTLVNKWNVPVYIHEKEIPYLGVASGKCGFTTLRKSKYKKPNFSV
ncbi:MBL fold metallo-hydrolase, partial [Niallia circulans]